MCRRGECNACEMRAKCAVEVSVMFAKCELNVP